MTTYLIKLGNWEQPRNFETIEAAKTWALINVGKEATVSVAGPHDQIRPKTVNEILAGRKMFGQTLQNTFVLDNIPFAPTLAQAEALLPKMREAWELCELGSLTLCSEKLAGIATDSIFTAERKAKYIQMIADYLASE